jgi:hypothetical protein
MPALAAGAVKATALLVKRAEGEKSGCVDRFHV